MIKRPIHINITRSEFVDVGKFRQRKGCSHYIIVQMKMLHNEEAGVNIIIHIDVNLLEYSHITVFSMRPLKVHKRLISRL